MQEQTGDMDDEWLVHHDILQDQDNFDSIAGEDGSADQLVEAGHRHGHTGLMAGLAVQCGC